VAKDKYGIPSGGNNGAWAAHSWGSSYQLTWAETIACVALGGWPESKWAEAAATAASESGRNPFIYNTYKKGHFGLFQISRSAHADFFAPGGEGMDWVAPWANSAEGYKVYQSQGWGAWEAHTNGTWLANYAQAKTAVAAYKKKAGSGMDRSYHEKVFRMATRQAVVDRLNKGGAFNSTAADALTAGIEAGAEGTAGGVVDSGAAVASSVGDMAQVVTGAWTALTTPAFWMRVAYGATGVVLVAGGLFLIVRSRPAVQKTASAVASVVPAGAALKAAKGA
jgi:hypothetical protein